MSKASLFALHSSYLIGVASLIAFHGAGATEITYDLPAGGGTTIALTLQNYTPGTPISEASNFVSLSFDDPTGLGASPLSFTLDAAQVSFVSGVVDPADPMLDNVTIDGAPFVPIWSVPDPEQTWYFDALDESNSADFPGEWALYANCIGDDCPAMIQQGKPRPALQWMVEAKIGVPEPDALMLLLLGLAACWGYGWLPRASKPTVRAAS